MDNTKVKVSMRLDPKLKEDALALYAHYNFNFTQIVEIALLKLIEEHKCKSI